MPGTSFFNWCYFTFTAAMMVSATIIVYIHSNISSTMGLAIPAVLMFLSCFFFFVGTPIYVRGFAGAEEVTGGGEGDICDDMSSTYKHASAEGFDVEGPEFIDEHSPISFIKEENTIIRIMHSLLKHGNKSFISIAANLTRTAIGKRFRLQEDLQVTLLDRLKLQLGEHGRQQNAPTKKSGPILSGAAYCVSSCSMILLNKIILSSFGFNAGISLMMYQNLICVLIVLILSSLGFISTEKITWKLVRVWIPVNIIFVGMLVTGMFSLKYINVAMVTILKNMTNILTALGEAYLFRKRQNSKVWAALFLMIVSAVSGGITDLSFDAVGYTWQTMNCILTAGYSLTLRRVMDTAKQRTKSGSLNEVSMVLLNNALSLPFALVLILLFNEWEYVYNAEVVRTPIFWVVATASGLLGLAISFTSMWFLNQTGPTTYSLVGSLNKIPISVAGLVLFKVPLSVPNMFSIFFGLFAGVFFAKAKMG
ncbi:hypothetical protein Taro_054024 [Colocasia esculenta]|uniref:Sugar phosphate transporter domain-containing protein n=1 Tax=Colocasia esculenta TaxID=4460 RepID=A0A843XP94_COLES|nr:hypothetical protein [Colocasia esculenta]